MSLEQTLREAISASRGHFRYESGHHGDLWLELDSLFLNARRTQAWASALAQQVSAGRPEVVCGPLTGGAFVAQLLAVELGAKFVFTERIVAAEGGVAYRLPESLRRFVPDRRVLLVDDAVNAGSAVSATLTNLLAYDIQLVGLASLLSLGPALSHLAEQHGVPFYTLLSLDREMWLPEACPLCRSGMPLSQ